MGMGRTVLTTIHGATMFSHSGMLSSYVFNCEGHCVQKYCRHCKELITNINGAKKKGFFRNECKPCRAAAQRVLNKKSQIEKMVACECCGISCVKKFIKAFCSDTCRFWGYVDKKDEGNCWIWKGKVGKDGYGLIMIKGVRIRAHRFIFEITNGSIKGKNVVRHSCHTPLCVNLAHLKEGTPRENIEDMLAARRSLVGEKCHLSKLNDEKVGKIRQLYKSGNCTQQEIATIYEISSGTVHLIVTRKTWKHID